MEDKELQELFEAKRTVEANRQRQEKLRKLVEAHSTQEPHRSRQAFPLWPLWASAAAAAVALLLILRPFAPSTIGSEGPVIVAKTETPTAIPQTTSEAAPQASPATTSRPRKAKETITEAKTTEGIVTIETIETIVPTEPSEPEEVLQEAVIETPAPARRVMRRTSTHIACIEGCTAPEGTSESSSRLQINLLSNENYADATIYSFPINK